MPSKPDRSKSSGLVTTRPGAEHYAKHAMKKHPFVLTVAGRRQGMVALGRRLAKIAKAKGKSAYAIGKQSQLSRDVVLRLLGGEKGVRLESAFQILHALDLDLEIVSRAKIPDGQVVSILE